MTRVKAWSEKTGFIDELIDLSEAEISSRFDEVIDFGTGGMRAVMAAGTNRMNVYTVRLASLGLVREIKSQDVTNPRVVISYDTRHNSRLYAEETARTLQHYGIEALVFEESRPTPMLSYAVRYYEATAGVMITASHNPKEYNGYKLYGSDGGQLTPEAVSSIRQVMQKEVDTILTLEMKQSEPIYILEELEAAYLKELMVLKSDLVERNLSIVYTPLHGSGREPIKKAFQAFGYKSLYLEPAQSEQKGSFPTVVVPNPEEKEAFKYAIKLGEEKSADILIATDPDADRLGVAVLHNGEYELLTGNQLGALLLYYKLNHLKSQGKLPENGVVIKTIVTSELGRKIAEHFNVEMEDTLTGFKYISEKIEQYTRTGEKTYLFGYEESYGYLLEPFARDKDAIQAAVATSELAQSYKKEDKTLVDGLNELYELFGYYRESLISLELDPIKGSEQVEALMNRFKVPDDTLISELEIEAIEDYQARKKYTLITDEEEPLNLPQENVIKYQLKDGAWICFRPSGTEPKMKIYLETMSKEKQVYIIEKINRVVKPIIGN